MLDWLLLTKRPENVSSSVPWSRVWPTNVWLGTTAEDQIRYDQRIDHLSRLPAAVLFLSCEPLLGPIRLDASLPLDWVIVGGESGAHARPMQPEWARLLRDQCNDRDVPFFFKQWGEWAPPDSVIASDNSELIRVGKKAAGRTLDGDIWNELPHLLQSTVKGLYAGPTRSDRRRATEETYAPHI
jgi:protein gp37